MSYRKRIVCLACSRKSGGRCVAGREALENGYGGWIRPVSTRPCSEISLKERQYPGGKLARLLDVIEVPMLAPAPNAHQTENHTIDASRRWSKIRTMSWNELGRLEETPASLWINGISTHHGRNDRIAERAASRQQSSLTLIRPRLVTVSVSTPYADLGVQKRAVRAGFQYANADYNLKITDPTIEQTFLAKENGDYRIHQDLYFCVSLGETHTDGYCYKLIATVFSERPL